MATTKIQTVKDLRVELFSAPCAGKYYSSLDGLDRSNVGLRYFEKTAEAVEKFTELCYNKYPRGNLSFAFKLFFGLS